MVEIFLQLSSGEIIRRCRVTGHAKDSRGGFSPACAAVSILVRTAARTLENHRGISLGGEAPEPGTVHFDLLAYDQELTGWLKGLSDSLLTGLLDIQEEYPKECRVNISI